jgi:predicted kinase
MSLLELCPAGPDWRLDWSALERSLPSLVELFTCPQDPVHHAEGDVGTHTRMVCEELTRLSSWRALPPKDRRVVFLGALLHDIEKPACTREAGGRITSRGHSRRGEFSTRELLWRAGLPLSERERVCALVRHHMVPFFALDRPEPERLLRAISLSTRCSDLALVAEADARGRVCRDQARILESVALFRELACELRCLDEPFAFPSDHTRVLYFRDPSRTAECEAYDDTRSKVVVLAGLPGAGKDHWITRNLPGWPTVSLDQLRARHKVSPRGDQGALLNRAREQAREYLRSGDRFCWNATNLSRELRGRCLDLLMRYKAKVRIVYVEVGPEALERQNLERAQPVPQAALGKLLKRWTVPDRTEAHELLYVTS